MNDRLMSEQQQLNLLLLKWLEGYNPRMTKYLCQKNTFCDEKVGTVSLGCPGGSGCRRCYGAEL